MMEWIRIVEAVCVILDCIEAVLRIVVEAKELFFLVAGMSL